MKRLVTIVAFLGVFVMFIGLPSALAAPAYSSGWIPFQYEVTNRCVPEQIIGAGMYSDLFTYTEDRAGGSHFTFIGKVRGTAVGQTTGAGYVFSESYNAVDSNPHTDGEVLKLPAMINLISLDSSVPDMRLRAVFTVIWDSNGNLRVDIFADEVYCSPN